ncbi:BolA family protein [Acanthopleuribacter pedis]|uniref:DNA-binding transcriptional regulator BolA n=1 Tax=Acanthopleuribacter pedis TaxID=442870 RepID=A0A8J7U3N3_9BACT|nr:BolA/IbaG family iron-sulfur metabolism protein [Acanthopleuribacter pedis]MBO1318944.1 BolA family transcriptional regulator [Acanthopleuribacter pedis]
MTVEQQINDKLVQHFQPQHLEVINESFKHNVPPNAETHFRVVMVAEQFDALKPVARHRQVNQLLAAELAGGVHALSLKLYSPQQWVAAGGEALPSPPCASKKGF